MSLSLSTVHRALITGAGSGIGYFIATQLAIKHGWHIIATDMNVVSESRL